MIAEKEIKPVIEYSDVEKEQLGRLKIDATNARNQKQQKYIESDDMDYETWYFKSKKAVQAYIKPRVNDEDVQVVTGTTREKGNTLVNTLLNYNLEPDITAYDEQNIIATEVGMVMTKLVKKSRSLELPEYDVKRPLFYTELVNQGNVFVRENWQEFAIPDKEIDWTSIGDGDLSGLKWKDKLEKFYAQCNSTMLTGLEVFPGNIRQYYMELQPFFIIRKVVSYAEAKAMAQTLNKKRFESVGERLMETQELMRTNNENTYDSFQMISTEAGLVEIVEYMYKFENEYQITFNGIPMLPVKFPLSALSGVCEYPIAKGDGEPISVNFFFSRGIGSKTRMDQALIDEAYKGAVLSDRLGRKPPLANLGNYDIGSDVYIPGKISKGINPEKLKPLMDYQGVTNAQMAYIQYVKSVIDGKTVDPIFEGQAPEKQSTRGQVMLQQQRSMVKLGMIMLGIINLERRMGWLRVNNILMHWTDPVDERVMGVGEKMKRLPQYRSISMDDTFENGQKGTKIIEFTEDVPTDEQTYAEEQLVERLRGQKVRITKINPKILKTIKYVWEINVVPTEKTTNLLKATMFSEYIREILTTFAPVGKIPNMDYLAERHARLNDENPEQVFPPAQANPMQQMMQGGQIPQPTQPSQRQAQMMPQAMPRPSLNTLQ